MTKGLLFGWKGVQIMNLDKRVNRLEESINPLGDHIYCLDDWTFEELWLYFSKDCPLALREKATKTDWNMTHHPQRKLEDYL